MKKSDLMPEMAHNLPFGIWGSSRMRPYQRNYKEFEATLPFRRLSTPVLMQLVSNDSLGAFRELEIRGAINSHVEDLRLRKLIASLKEFSWRGEKFKIRIKKKK